MLSANPLIVFEVHHQLFVVPTTIDKYSLAPVVVRAFLWPVIVR
jgi:hypothetical protein